VRILTALLTVLGPLPCCCTSQDTVQTVRTRLCQLCQPFLRLSPVSALRTLRGAGPAGGRAAAGPAGQAPAQAPGQARVVQIAGVQLSKRKLAEAEILAIPGLPGLPDLLGDQPLRLLIGGNNPSEHAWCARQALHFEPGMIAVGRDHAWAHGAAHAVSLQVQGSVGAVVSTLLWTQMHTSSDGASQGVGRPGSTQAVTSGSAACDASAMPWCKPERLPVTRSRPGRRSGHYYSHPANHMWRLLIRTGVAPPTVQGPAVRAWPMAGTAACSRRRPREHAGCGRRGGRQLQCRDSPCAAAWPPSSALDPDLPRRQWSGRNSARSVDCRQSLDAPFPFAVE